MFEDDRRSIDRMRQEYGKVDQFYALLAVAVIIVLAFIILPGCSCRSGDTSDGENNACFTYEISR